ncbi:ABC transporter ATP-binding protein [Hymenobacter negativus]|uniref:ABC transporter ATP-binding protein n=1 Tax=Hymenobacter negativus TaxID=2795026 RepID=A0ABS0QBG0_9BACT|nr:ABC transporter ATP-binding protein [Hymenobacter negativus]MBH8560009.1 ABC transporter ATP-binding protein [Hymenobacter negativus]
MTDAAAVVTVRNLSKKFCSQLRTSLWYGLRDIAAEAWPGAAPTLGLRRAEFWSLHELSFELRRGEALAIIGANGAGKSTLLKLLNGLIKPDAGSIHLRGRVGALIELGAGLDPVLTGRENIFMRAALLGVGRAQVLPLLPAIIEFTGLGAAIDMPVQFFSSGMVARLAYAVAAHLHPDVLLVDEVLAVGDIDFQRKCIHHMMSYLAAGGSLILVSHQPHHMQAVCQRGLVLEKGRLAFEGTTTEALDYYFSHQKAGAASATGLPERMTPTLSEACPAFIEDLELTGPGPVIQSGDEVLVTLTYQALRPVPGVIWGFFVYSGDGSTCITAAYPPAPLALAPGRHRLTCRLRSLPLTAGDYLLKAAISDFENRQSVALWGWEDAPGRLHVGDAPSMTKNTQKMLQQLVTVEVEWN